MKSYRTRNYRLTLYSLCIRGCSSFIKGFDLQRQQECIPVGCVPPACCPYLAACTALGGGAVYLPGGVGVLGVSARGVYLPGRVYLLGGVPDWGCTFPGGCTCRGLYLPGGCTNRISDCSLDKDCRKNIAGLKPQPIKRQDPTVKCLSKTRTSIDSVQRISSITAIDLFTEAWYFLCQQILLASFVLIVLINFCVVLG